ncbi:spermidine hydroxycinnamoyl transferase-like [Salvia hispanica]|uniref:spermidine hydroxycinnamoyl transferase-like n=1 Tax=Salvia hispanica TaxID=49212 RepID=UPI00200970E5|nr:spermidine hydroxycinnamoyl transferase-like [Salvia hispanica]
MVVSVKATHVVRPAEERPDETMYLNSGDQIKEIVHTPTIYFYNHSPALEAADVVSVLKDSLSKALAFFYPLAGRLHWSEAGGSRVELHCNGAGAPIFEAETDAAIVDFGDFTPTQAIEPLIPSFDYTTPLHHIPMVLVQLTRFRCGGLSIGLGISHVMADGPSALHFVAEWTKLARGGGPIAPPFLDRKAVESNGEQRFEFDPSALLPPPSLIDQEEKSPIVVALLNLSKADIEKLRVKANVDRVGDRGYSRFESVAAHIWRCTSEARGHAAEQQTSLVFVADFRNKLNPPLPKNYFGNALIRVEARDTSGSLVSEPIGAVARKLREAVEKVGDEGVRGYLEYLSKLEDVGRFRSLDNEGRPKVAYYGNPNVVIISWVGLPLYGTDFGWGNEVHVGPGSVGFDGKAYILPHLQEDGAFQVAIWLQENHMQAFKTCFYHNI